MFHLKIGEISPSNLKKNLVEKYQYRGLDDPTVYYNENIQNLLQNYRSGFIQLAEYYAREEQNEELKEILKVMDEKVRPDVIVWTSRALQVVKDAFYIAADSSLEDSIVNSVSGPDELQLLGEQLMRMRKMESAVRILEFAFEQDTRNPKALGLLINAYEMSGQSEKSVEPLEAWMKMNPGDKNAERILQSIKQRTKN